MSRLSDFAAISDWSTQNGMCLTSQKTKDMAVYRSETSFLPPVNVCKTTIIYSTKVKNLGELMNCNLTWDDPFPFSRR
jgi:hypothetical protein